ncbi:MAG: DUF2294 family protein [Firmicutes bacterium]|nr:DUF2294 family protein [Bacillota bacterium]
MLSNVRQFPDNPLNYALAKSLSQLQQDYTERRPSTSKVYIVDDLLIYRSWGVLNKAELQLVEEDPEGARMVQELLEQQWNSLTPLVQARIQEHTGNRALGVSVSLNPEQDELIILCRMV